MSAIQRIGVFYSIRHKFAQVLMNVRRCYPDAKITAVVPKGYVMLDEERKYVDDTLETEFAKYSPKDPAAMLRLMQLVRGQKYDLFIVLYTSIRHRLIAGASGATRCECWSIDGRVFPVANSVIAGLSAAIGDVVGGYAKFVLVWLSVYLNFVRPKKRSQS